MPRQNAKRAKTRNTAAAVTIDWNRCGQVLLLLLTGLGLAVLLIWIARQF